MQLRWGSISTADSKKTLLIELAVQMGGVLVDIILSLLSAVDAQEKYDWIQP